MGSKPTGISASRGAAILGLNQYQTMFEIWQIIMEERQPGFNSLAGYTMPEPPDNAAIRWGLAFEDAVCELAGNEYDSHIVLKEEFNSLNHIHKHYFLRRGYINIEIPITCHVDGFYDAGTSPFKTMVIHEGKTTSIMTFNKKWGPPETDKIPREYQVQCQHQMACTGASDVILSVLVFPKSPEEWEQAEWSVVQFEENNPWFIEKKKRYSTMFWAQSLSQMGFFHQYHIKRNQDLIDSIIEKYSRFWEKNILGEIPPDPINIDDIKRLAPEPVGTIVLPDHIIDLYREYKLIKKEIGASGTSAKRAEQVKTLILDAARKIESVIDDESTDKWLFYDSCGNKLGSWGKNKRGSYVFR